MLALETLVTLLAVILIAMVVGALGCVVIAQTLHGPARLAYRAMAVMLVAWAAVASMALWA